MNNDITIVTAFFDIGRGRLPTEMYGRHLPFYQHRNVDTYFDYFAKLAKLQNKMVIYTSPDFSERVFSIRKNLGLENDTKVVELATYLPEEFLSIKQKIEKIHKSPSYIQNIINPQLIEYWHSDYVLVNILKSWYVTDAINNQYINSDLVSWIDFGYCRDDNTIPKSCKWKFDFDPEKIHMFNQHQIDFKRPIDNIIHTGDVYIQGCHLVGGIRIWEKFKNVILKNLDLLIENDLIDDDQTLLLMAYLTNPELFQLHPANPNDWFLIFKEYNKI